MFNSEFLSAGTLIVCYFGVLAFILGTVFGSFFNCMAWRMAHGEKIWKGRSHCATCGHTLSIGDLVPIFSWLIRRGRCKYCGEKISVRYMLTEVFMGLLFVWCLFTCGLTVECLRDLVFLCMLFTLSLVDLEIYEIPDGLLIAAAAAFVIALPFGGDVWQTLKSGLLGGFIIGGGMLVLSLIMDKVLGKDTLGGGDIKLLAVCGLYLGLLRTLFGLILACILGLLFAALGKRRKKDSEDPARIPFGPSISAAMWIMLMVGGPLTDWYLSLL